MASRISMQDVQTRNAALSRKRWSILAASCLANLCVGSVYSWSVFAGPMAGYLNTLNNTSLTAADLAIVFSLANGDAFITMILGGILDRTLGARLMILIGVTVFGLGFIVSGMATNTLTLALGYGILCGLAEGFTYVCTISNTVKFFPDKKGLAGGISTASYGLSSILIPPVADALTHAVGVNRAFLIFGAVIIGLAFVSSLSIVNCPDDFVPDGWTPQAGMGTAGAGDKSTLQMLSSSVFYVMLAMLFVGSTLGLMAISEAASIAQTMIGMTSAAAALVVSVLALFNTAGRIAAGWISDRIGRVNTLMAVYILAATASLTTYVSGGNKSVALFCGGICLIGLCYGAFMGVYPGFTSDQFGLKHSSLNYGVMFVGFSSAGFAGPMTMRAVFNGQGSYRPAFLMAAGLAVSGLAISFLYRAIAKKGELSG